MSCWKTLINRALTFLCIYTCVTGSKENRKIEILKELILRANCDIKQLLPFPNDGDIVRCSTFGRFDKSRVPNRSLCQVTRNDTVLQYHCVEGSWKLSKGTDPHLRHKRAIPWVAIGAIASVVLAAVAFTTVVYCFATAGNINCAEEKELKAPEYVVCPPANIKKLYIAKRKQKEVKVPWDDPYAIDDKKVVSNKQTGGINKGQPFPGLPNEGRLHNIIYTAKDEHGLTDTCIFSFHVKYLACKEPPTPLNGRKVSCSEGYIYGGECKFECFDGYEMAGSEVATCQQDETWDNTPICTKVRCNPPFTVKNGAVTCDGTNFEFDDDCLLSCDDGFKLSGPSKMTCKSDKTWSVDSTEVNCVDDDPPVIKCHTTQVFYADRGSFHTSVKWNVPNATDNVDENPTIMQTSGPELGDTLSEGFHYVKYTVKDRFGNSIPALSECTITLEVKVIKCFTGPTDSIGKPRFMNYNCSDTPFYYGVSCLLYCDLNLPLNGTNHITCERDGKSDKGKWSFGSDHHPFCEVVDCPALDPPKHGSLTSDSVSARPLHVMSCQSGYDIPSVGSQFVGRLSCQDSGDWFPLAAFPDCIVSDHPWLNLPIELYYNGDCHDNHTKTQIKKQVLIYLSGVDNSLCSDNSTCKIENLDVVCGDSRKRKRKSVSSHIFYKRNAYGQIRFNILKKLEHGVSQTQTAYVDISKELNKIADKIEEDAQTGAILNLKGFTILNDGVQKGKLQFLCSPGYKIDTGSLSCKPCPQGFYLSSDTGNCELCKVGEYMAKEGARQCDRCEDGYSTLDTGSKDRDKCLLLCGPGSFSSTEMEPCSPCPFGTFQSKNGQSKCIQCPAGQTTSKTSSISIDDCNFFDLFVHDITQRTNIGSFKADQLSVLTMSVWLKPQDEVNVDVSIFVADSFGDIMILRLGSEISIEFEFCKVTLKSPKLSRSHWTHIICEKDIADTGKLRVYLDGKIVAEEAEIRINPSRTFSAGRIDLVANTNGIYMTGLVLYGRALNDNDIATLSQTCEVTSNNELFSMTEILQNIKEGIEVITPTSCDPIDECINNPCGDHTCVNKLNEFSCICHGGMTGALCDVPPDFCINNKCVHGGCQSGNGTYSCTCNNGYSGVLCNIPSVNGEWSQWSEWSGCDVTCGGGVNVRSRSCDNPTPSPYGKDCEGDRTDTVTCNDKACPACSKLRRQFGTVVKCYNVSETLQKCNMTCLPDRALTNGQANFAEYTCGNSTGYDWLPTDKLPECVELNLPDVLGVLTTVEYTKHLSRSTETNVTAEVENNLAGFSCLSNDACAISVTASNSNEGIKRGTATTKLTVQFSVKLFEKGSLDLAGFISNRTETPAMTELLEALTSIYEVAEFMQNNTESIFEVTVEDVTYKLESTSMDFAASVTCPSGYAGASGLCAQCPVGTYFVDIECLNCKVGTYQPFTGQNKCLTCPSGYTTASIGSSDISECSVKIKNETVAPDGRGNGENHEKYNVDKDNSTTLIIVATVCVIVFMTSVIVGGICIWKYVKRKRIQNYEMRRSLSPSENILDAGFDKAKEGSLTKAGVSVDISLEKLHE